MSFLKKVNERMVVADDHTFVGKFSLEVLGDFKGVKTPFQITNVNAEVELKYQVDFSQRDWGISSVAVRVPNQEISFDLDEIDGDSEVTKTVKFKVENATVSFESTDDILNGFGILPHEIVIDNNVPTVTFTIG